MAMAPRALVSTVLTVLLTIIVAEVSDPGGHLRRNNEYISFSLPVSHGLEIPRLGFGTAGLGRIGEFLTHEALKAGTKLIDTAQAMEWYDEAQVGNGINVFRESNGTTATDSLVLVTKVHPRSFAKHKMDVAIADSKRKLYHVDNRPIEVVLLHSPHCWQGHCTREEESVSWKEGWRNLEQSMTDGNALAIGVSNFGVHELEELFQIANEKVSVIQNWMDPFHQDLEVRQFAEEHNMIYMAYSSLGTQWEGKFNSNPVLQSKVLQEIANKHGSTIPAVIISWLVQEGVVAIPRASKVPHIHANFASVEYDDLGEPAIRVFLGDEDMQDIRALDGTLGNPWD